jgi:hypothetical protein
LFLLGFTVKNYHEQTVNLHRTPCGDVKMESAELAKQLEAMLDATNTDRPVLVDLFYRRIVAKAADRIEAQAALIAELVAALECLMENAELAAWVEGIGSADPRILAAKDALAKAKAVQP